jgi:hypothetical protein
MICGKTVVEPGTRSRGDTSCSQLVLPSTSKQGIASTHGYPWRERQGYRATPQLYPGTFAPTSVFIVDTSTHVLRFRYCGACKQWNWWLCGAFATKFRRPCGEMRVFILTYVVWRLMLHGRCAHPLSGVPVPLSCYGELSQDGSFYYYYCDFCNSSV